MTFCYRGVYLACLLYHGDKVLVTSDDQMPVVEVDENFSGPSVNADLHWLMKVQYKMIKLYIERNIIKLDKMIKGHP
jgi:hypothetical protein